MKTIKLIILLLIFTNFQISKTDQSENMKVNFDKLFPESKAEKLQNQAIKLSYLVNNAEKFEVIEKELLNILLETYLLSDGFMIDTKRSNKSINKDICYLKNIICFSKQQLNEKFNNKAIESINFIFDKLLLNIDKEYLTNYQT